MKNKTFGAYILIYFFSCFLISCTSAFNIDRFIQNSVDKLKPTVNVGTPSPSTGDSTTTFSFPVTYSGADTVSLTSVDITVNATGPSCDVPVIYNGSTTTPTVTLNNCTGNGSVGISVAANTSSDEAGNQNLASSASSTVTVTNPICPTGGAEGEYILVPGNSGYGTSDFCVMKYEAKSERDSDSQINSWGCLEGTANCGQDDWVLNTLAEASTPVSVETGRPWREISRDQALAECQSLGAGFDLITNGEWQTIARNIELQTNNWEEGVVGGVSTGNGGTNSNRLNRGHADDAPSEPLAANASDSQGCEGTGQTCNGGSGGDWNLEKRTHNLSNGEVIWDIGGNVWEWVKDNNSNSYGTYSYISQITFITHPNSYALSGGSTTAARIAKDQFGPFEDYTSLSSIDYGGLGYGFVNSDVGAVLRGGVWYDDTYSGVFAANLFNGPSFSSFDLGFRCVFRP